MNNIRHLFIDDLKRLTRNVVACIIVLGLVFTPSIFSWYNILACWDIFSNTGNLTVAVANTDEGYQSDLVPLRINVGEEVVSALRSNDQLNWTFTSEDDAIDGVESGEYYAAVVIPPSFSQDMMTFYSDDVTHAQIIYYTNDKKNAVAPRITGQGADTVSYQVNETFTETLSELALGISSSLYNYADTSDATGQIGALADHLDTMSSQMTQTASVLGTYISLIDSAQSLIDGSSKLLAQAQGSAQEVSDDVDGNEQSVTSLSDALASSSDALSAALASSSSAYSALSDEIDSAFTSADTLSADTSTQLRDQAAAIDGQITEYENIVGELTALKNQVDPQYQQPIDSMISLLNTSIDTQTSLRDQLTKTADDIDSGNGDVQSDYAAIRDLMTQAEQSVTGVDSDFNSNLRPDLEQLDQEVATTVASLKSSANELDEASSALQGSSGSVSEQLAGAKLQLQTASGDLNTSSQKLAGLSQSIRQALSTGDSEALRTILTSDPETLATVLAAPVQMNRQAVFSADNFGSQMAPLYTTLGLWIGALLLVVAIKVSVSEEARRKLDDPKPHQLFLGRFGVFGVMAFLQATVMGLGNLLFLGVQACHPFLYMLCLWVTSLVFTFVIYALVVSFANLGKAIAVLLLIFQVTGGGGSYPLPVLPHFFTTISPYLPATHAINAMRAAMMGIYANDFWIAIVKLLIFLIPAALLGLALRKPLINFLNWYLRKVEDSKLMA